MRVLQSGFCWPSLFKDAHTMCKSCDRCQRALTSWDHSLCLLAILTSWWEYIMFLSGLRQSHASTMTIEWGDFKAVEHVLKDSWQRKNPEEKNSPRHFAQHCEIFANHCKIFVDTVPLRISLPPCGLFIVSPSSSVLVPPSVQTPHSPRISLLRPSPIRHPPPSSTNLRYGTDPRALAAPSQSRTPRQRASSTWVPRDSPPQEATIEAPQIPPFEGGAPASPSSSTPQHRAKTSSPSESSRVSQPKPPVVTHARAPADYKLHSDMSSGSIIRLPMLTAPLIEGNLDY
ncbi:hypothetical protein CK203_064664 [Vitis vinifera]|uniref:Integrase zinc-binding domain-containing protein n=1 Tax=Vitis vinifera TaxID=29760 RepID=A0A438FQA7_VITVI|nr:hypothetical protein CK203_064664 [Vitis vinifera]